MTPTTFSELVANRLEHLADRVEALTAQGKHADADMLRAEGFALADAFDREEAFFFIGATV